MVIFHSYVRLPEGIPWMFPYNKVMGVPHKTHPFLHRMLHEIVTIQRAWGIPSMEIPI